VIAAALLLAAATPAAVEQKAPFLPPTADGMRIVHVIERTQLPSPNADNLRLCVKDGQLCGYYRQQKGVGVTITIPLGKRHH
jgi:hypothetical protein